MDDKPRLQGSVKRITQLKKDDSGAVVPVTIYKKRGKKRKVSGPLQPIEKAVRRLATAQVAFSNSYRDRHNRSNEKKRDGWVVDLIPNIADAGRKGSKKLRRA